MKPDSHQTDAESPSSDREADTPTVAEATTEVPPQETLSAPDNLSSDDRKPDSGLEGPTFEDDRRRTMAALLEPPVAPANDDQASIGALVKTLGTRASWTPIIGAMIATVFWIFCLVSLYAETGLSNSEVVVFGLGITGVYSILLLMIAVFARSIETHNTTRNLVKVVAGLANPDTLASAKVGGVSKVVKSEMASIDDSLDRTLSRAGRLEGLLKSEYLDFERSFIENEQRVRNFIDSLSTERAAIVTNAEKVRSAIAGAHQNLSRDLDEASVRFSRLIGEASVSLAGTIDQKSAEMTKAASLASDRCVAKLDSALEGSIIRASDLVENRGDKFAALLSNKGNDLDEKLSARIKDASDLLERQIKDAQDKAAFRVDAMATQIDKLLKKMDAGIGERGEAINAMLATRTLDIAKTLKETGNEFRQTLDRTASVADDFATKAHAINEELGDQVDRLSEGVVVPLGQITSALDDKGRMLTLNLADRFAKIDSMLTTQSNRLDSILDREIETLRVTLDSSIDAVKSALGGGSADLKTSLAERAQKIEAVLSERLSAFSSLITENRTRLAFELSSHTQSLDHMLDRQRALITDLAAPPRLTSTAEPSPIRISAERSISESNVPATRPKDSAPSRLDRSVATPRNPYLSGPLQDRLSAIDRVQTSSARVIDDTPTPTTRARQYIEARAVAAPSSVASQQVVASVPPPAPPAPKPSVPPKTSSQAQIATTGPKVTANANVAASKTWLSDLLARASIDEDTTTQVPNEKPNYQDAPISSIAANVGNFIKPDELQASWERYNSGGSGDFQNIYTPKGAVMQLKIKQRLVEDVELRQAVNSYVTEFERLLQEVHQDNGDDLIFEYLHTDAGKVYTMLAHASNRLGGAG